MGKKINSSITPVSTSLPIHLRSLTSALLTAGLLSACGGGEGGAGGQFASDYIVDSGKFELAEERSAPDPDRPAETITEVPVGDGVTATCTTEGWGESEVREIVNTVGLDLSGTNIFPGALLQGKHYENGDFVPVTIPRAPGTIYMTGLVLEPGATYHAQDIPMSGSEVETAIKGLITDYGIQGTTANAGYSESQVHSYESMLFELGIDARYGSATMEADLSIDSEKERSYTFVKFTQVYYSMVYEDPETASSVFRDGAGFVDPEGQIGEGNPPLYVSKVNYGRMVFFVAESTHDALEVEAALSAAVRGGAADVTVDSGLTHKEVLERSTVYYYVVGGNAGMALQPIKESTQEGMFQAVKSFIADRNAANFSASSPGAPISYTMNYLADRTPVRMSYTVNYDKKDCEFTYTEAPPVVVQKPRYYLELSGIIGGEAHVSVNGSQCGGDATSAKQIDLYRCLGDSGNHDVRVYFNRKLCSKASISWYVTDRGTTVFPSPTAVVSKDSGCSDFEWHFTVNTTDSTFSNYQTPNL